MTNTKALREKHAELLTKARAYADEHEADWTEDREAVFDKMLAEAMDHKNRADRLDRLTEAEDALKEPAGGRASLHLDGIKGSDGANANDYLMRGYGLQHGEPVYVKVAPGKRGTSAYRGAFDKWLRGDRLAPEQYAALQSDSDTQAGYLLASEQMAAGILKAVDDLVFVRRYAKIHTVREASSLGIRKRTARASTFNWSAELQVSTADSALAYGKKVLTPHHCTGDISVSRDLLRRSMFPVEQIVSEEFARDAGEVMEDAFFTGSGSQRPLGVFTASADGISTSQDVSTGNTTTAITADGLIEAKYALKGQYRRGERGSIRWLFHRTGVKQIAKLKDGEGRYLWSFGMRDGEPDMLLGYPVDESERAPSTFTTGQYVGLLANWNYYEIADALDMEIQRLEELRAGTNQVGFIGRLKTDGMPTLEEAFVRVTLA